MSIKSNYAQGGDMKVKCFLILFCLLFLAGCMNRVYVDPVNVPVVSMEFVNKSPGYFLTTMVYEDDYDCYDMRYIQQKAFKAKKREYYTIAYNYFSSRGTVNVNCGGAYSFKLEDADYMVMTSFVDNKCSFLVLKRKTGDSPDLWLAESNLIKRKPKYSFFKDGPWCEADPKLRGSSSLPVPRGDNRK
jgi:hypothetical protein